MLKVEVIPAFDSYVGQIILLSAEALESLAQKDFLYSIGVGCSSILLRDVRFPEVRCSIVEGIPVVSFHVPKTFAGIHVFRIHKDALDTLKELLCAFNKQFQTPNTKESFIIG